MSETSSIIKNSLGTGAVKGGNEVAAAIAVALSLHAGANIHDRESYVITIRRKRRDGDVVFID